MIVVENLVKAYGRHLAVNGVSFEVERGEIVGFLGPNGAGKTTTMRILTCFLPATSGRLQVAGYDVLEDSREVRRHLGYLPENVPLYLDMSVDDYLTYIGKLRGLDRSKLKQRLNEVVANCGLEHRRRDLVGRLSRGYRQRVGLAQALIHDPEVVILDEPTASLDPAQIREVREYIKSLAGNHTIILSTHILPEVELTCDRVLMINRGQIVANDTPQNLRGYAAQQQSIVVEATGDEKALGEALGKVAGIDQVDAVGQVAGGAHRFRLQGTEDVRPEVARTVVQGGYGLLTLEIETKSLEDIFVELTTEEPAVLETAEVA
ncbi:MAG: ATP-binding cassette domain-containing protein [Armatimonadetes bacterium]|nr:ATP-binding cassette domain-containing protein [Armatimonadota bacterium]